jgi:hypothetical protein
MLTTTVEYMPSQANIKMVTLFANRRWIESFHIVLAYLTRGLLLVLIVSNLLDSRDLGLFLSPFIQCLVSLTLGVTLPFS